jgi:hypothetical protein
LVESSTRLFIAAAFAVFLCYYSILLHHGQLLLQDPDTFWHIRTGEWILAHAQFPTIDFYSHTIYGKPWISTEWLSEIFYAVAYKLGGWRAVTILAVTACATLVGILCFYLLRNLRFSVAIGWTVLTAAAIGPHFLARPHVFSYILLTIWLINLLNAYDYNDFSLPSLLTLTPLMVLWANLHGSFTFGLALLYVFAGFCLYQSILERNYTRCARLLLVTFVVTASALITPYGISAAFMTIEQLHLKFANSQVIEFRSPDFQRNPLLLIYLVSIFVALAGLGIRLRGPRLIIFALILAAGLSYFRGLMMFFFLMPIILARPVAKSVWYLAPQGMTTLESHEALDPVLTLLQRRSLAILAGCMAFAALITASTWWREDIVPSKAIAPKAAIDFVKRTNISGNVFNSYGFGGYLIFLGIPTFVDGRALPFGDVFLHEYFDTVDLIDINKAFDTLDQYKVNWIILLPMEPLTKALAQSELWDEVYSDEYAVVFVRRRQLLN